MTTSASSSSSSSSSTDTALIKAKFAALLAEQKNLAESINAKILTINRITAEIATTKNDLQARKAAKGDLDSCYFELVSEWKNLRETQTTLTVNRNKCSDLMQQLETDQQERIASDIAASRKFTEDVDEHCKVLQDQLMDKYEALTSVTAREDLDVILEAVPEKTFDGSFEAVNFARAALHSTRAEVQFYEKEASALEEWKLKSLACTYVTAENLAKHKAAMELKDGDPVTGVNIIPTVGVVKFEQALKYFGEAAQRIARDGIEVDKFVDFDSAMLGWHKYRDATVAK